MFIFYRNVKYDHDRTIDLTPYNWCFLKKLKLIEERQEAAVYPFIEQWTNGQRHSRFTSANWTLCFHHASRFPSAAVVSFVWLRIWNETETCTKDFGDLVSHVVNTNNVKIGPSQRWMIKSSPSKGHKFYRSENVGILENMNPNGNHMNLVRWTKYSSLQRKKTGWEFSASQHLSVSQSVKSFPPKINLPLFDGEPCHRSNWDRVFRVLEQSQRLYDLQRRQ